MAEEPAHSTTRKHSVDDVHDPSIVKKSRTSQHGSKNITSYDLKSWQPSPGRDTKKKLKPQKRREQARRKAQAEKETNPVREGGVEERCHDSQSASPASSEDASYAKTQLPVQLPEVSAKTIIRTSEPAPEAENKHLEASQIVLDYNRPLSADGRVSLEVIHEEIGATIAEDDTDSDFDRENFDADSSSEEDTSEDDHHLSPEHDHSTALSIAGNSTHSTKDPSVLKSPGRFEQGLVHVPPVVLRCRRTQKRLQGLEFWEVRESTSSDQDLQILVPGTQKTNEDLGQALLALRRVPAKGRQALATIACGMPAYLRSQVLHATAYARVAQLALRLRTDDEINPATIAVFLNEKLAIKYVLQEEKLRKEAAQSYTDNIVLLQHIATRLGVQAIQPKDRLCMPLLTEAEHNVLEYESQDFLKKVLKEIRMKLRDMEASARSDPPSRILGPRLLAGAGCLQIDHLESFDRGMCKELASIVLREICGTEMPELQNDVAEIMKRRLELLEQCMLKCPSLLRCAAQHHDEFLGRIHDFHNKREVLKYVVSLPT